MRSWCVIRRLIVSLRLREDDVRVARPGGGVERLHRMLPFRGARRLDDDRMIRLEQATPRRLADLPLREEPVQGLEVVRLGIRSVDDQAIALPPDQARFFQNILLAMRGCVSTK